ncbi:MAG TPA: hypothetical protein VHO03_17405 [Ignavibacteriales bacterium]|nr:hypothetical protein [Ignavibacteriales bacterium]
MPVKGHFKMRPVKIKNLLRQEDSVGLFLSLGVHTVLIIAVLLFKILWPEFGKSSSVEVDLLQSRKAEASGSAPKVLSAIDGLRDESGPPKGETAPADAPDITENSLEGTGNIQANEKEGAGSGQVPLPSREGQDLLNVQGMEPDKRGLGSTAFSGGNGNAEGEGQGVFLATGFGGYSKGNGGAMENLPRLPFIPRQVLEVVPEKPEDNLEGEIDLILRIGTDGRVREHRVSSNTINSYKYLNSVIKAAYRSKWEAVTFQGSKVEYWILKKYSFN